MNKENASPLAAAMTVVSAQAADPMEAAKARALLRGYAQRWLDRYRRVRILAVEPEFRFRLVNPETGGQSQTFDVAGKIDVLIEEDGRVKLVEHKTSGESIDPDSAYWDRLTMDTQISGYILGAELALGMVPETVIYDVIRKPNIQPTDVPILDADGLKIVIDDATGERATNKNGAPRQSGGSGFTVQSRPCTPEEYEERLAQDIQSRPEFYFAAREVARLDSDLMEYLADIWARSQQILYFRNRGIWPRNPSACTSFGVCPYFALCAGHASVDGVTYGRTGQLHPELATRENGRQLLTNTRLLTLRTCERKHQLRYEEGIERIGEESDALRFGSLIHAGLEAWFGAIKNMQQT